MDELIKFVLEKLELHKMILAIVKNYIDDLMRAMGLEKLDDNTYFAMILELTRSIFISWENEQRKPRWRS